MIDKLQIYFQPGKNTDGIRSFTLSCSRFDETNNTYRRKLTLEKEDHKYKIKKYCSDLDKLLKILKLLDLSDRPNEKVEGGQDLYCIKFGDQMAETSDKKKIQDILDLFDFDKEFQTNLNEYKCVE